MKKISRVITDALKNVDPQGLKTFPETSYRCNICKDRGLILHDNSAVKCSCTKQQISALQKFALFGEALQNASFENFDYKYYAESPFLEQKISERESAVKAVREAKAFILKIKEGQKTKGVMLTGNVGSGKTHLAAAITNTLRKLDIEVMFAVVPDLLDEMRSTYKSDELNESDIMDAAKNAAVLVLDDLGAHNYTEWTRNKLFSLLNFRLTHLLPTVITTNLDMQELEEHLGERTTSRIVELCKIYRLNVCKDIRFQKNLKR